MPAIYKNGKQYAGIPDEVVTAWEVDDTMDLEEIDQAPLGTTDISYIGDGSLTGAISELKSDSTREGVFTGTTSSAGNISVGKTISEIKVISGYTQSGNYMCVPWLLSGTNWYFRVLKEINGSIVPETNTNVTIHYMYKY